MLYDRLIKKEVSGSLGQALYTQCLFFCDPKKLLDRISQDRIKEYSFTQTSKIPVYNSMQEMPVSKIDDYMIISEEIEAHRKSLDKKEVAE